MNRHSLSLGFAAILSISAPVSHALPFADTVVSFTPGIDYGVDDESGGTYTGMSGEGVFDPLAVTALDGAVLGLGGAVGAPGTITMRFTTGEVIDGPGADLRLYDTFSFADGFSLDISADGANFVHAFSFAGDVGIFTCSLGNPCITDVDISGTGLGAFSYLRIATAGNSGQGFPAGYTLDAVEALNFRPFTVPEPGAFTLFGIATAALAAVRRRTSGGRVVAGES
ncbi:MAG: PEP-CTERM sorting domain-containing protein [Betaproteobacteria bacterium]|nr:PEP-CTERM sorting domain-containing protein [Betaproteobacteria bacterium]